MISIVIPALNEEKYLPACLDSLKNQDYCGEYEIILADNGSTDSTPEIARSFGARVVPCPEKKSVFYARQVGADAARGEIVVQADADTVYPSGWLQRIATQFETHPKAVAVAGRFSYRDPPFWARVEYALRSFWNAVAILFFRRPLIISGATFAFRREVFVVLGGYEGLNYAADQYGIADRLSKAGRIIYDPKVMVLTSSRTVQKSVGRIVLDLNRNVFNWFVFLGKCCVSSVNTFSNKSPMRRLATRAAPAVIVAGLFLSYGYFIPTSTVFGKVYYDAKLQDKVVALTFDDGPNDPYTSQILDVLDKYNIKATFFLVGKNVELYPDTAKRMLAEGHVVGNHSYNHNANHALTEYGAKDLGLAQEAIYDRLGVLPHLYRPPHGKKSPWELNAVKKDGLVEITWSVATREIGIRNPDTLAKNIVKKVGPGEIILLHDGYGTLHNALRSDKSVTVKALPRIIEQLQARGYRFVTVPELLNIPAYNN